MKDLGVFEFSSQKKIMNIS